MKRFIAIAIIGFFSVSCSSSDDWASRGDNLVEKGNYAAAYSAYMSRCNDPSGSHNMRMAGCQAGRDLRLKAKRYGVDTSNW